MSLEILGHESTAPDDAGYKSLVRRSNPRTMESLAICARLVVINCIRTSIANGICCSGTTKCPNRCAAAARRALADGPIEPCGIMRG
jgi:hypothetical protein